MTSPDAAAILAPLAAAIELAPLVLLLVAGLAVALPLGHAVLADIARKRLDRDLRAVFPNAWAARKAGAGGADSFHARRRRADLGRGAGG